MNDCFWTTLGNHFSQHAEAYKVFLIALAIAMAKCLPKPGSSFSWLTLYTFFYDTTQAFVPVPRSSVSTNSVAPGIQVPPTTNVKE